MSKHFDALETRSAHERESALAVTRKDLRKDWLEIWPELADAPADKAAA